MATICTDRQSPNFYIRFRFAGRAFRRSLKCRNRKEAIAALGRVEETLRLIERGSILMPPEADPATFILSGGRCKRGRVVPLSKRWASSSTSMTNRSSRESRSCRR